MAELSGGSGHELTVGVSPGASTVGNLGTRGQKSLGFGYRAKGPD